METKPQLKHVLSTMFASLPGVAAELRPIGFAPGRPAAQTQPIGGSGAIARVTRADSGFVRLPEFGGAGTTGLSFSVIQRYALYETLPGRLWMRMHIEFRRLENSFHETGPETLKRAFDIVASLVLLLILSPLFAVIALLVKLEDGGPILYKQRRVGLFGREFNMLKVRSMCLDADAKLQELLSRNQHREGVTFKLKNDPRITRVGKWLRKFSLDELPQLYNVLVGDMSLVGPRPPVPREVALYTLADRRRLAAKPGITCIWQVSGRSEIDFSGQVTLDVRYIETRTFWLDLKLLVLTVPAVITGRGAC